MDKRLVSDVDRILNDWIGRSLRSALAKYGREVPGAGVRIVATTAELREVFLAQRREVY